MRTKIGILKEEYAALKTAMDDLSDAYEGIARQRDVIAKRMEDLRREIVEVADSEVTPETLITLNIEEVH